MKDWMENLGQRYLQDAREIGSLRFGRRHPP